MIDTTKAREFLTCGRIAVVGASDDPKNFGGNILRALAEHGVDVVPVNPGRDTVADRACFATVTDVPGRLDGVLVMVPPDAAIDVVRAAAARGVTRVWLFKGIGAPGAVSAETVALCDALGVDVVAGACPLMFLDPVRGAHRVHRVLRRMNRAISKAA